MKIEINKFLFLIIALLGTLKIIFPSNVISGLGLIFIFPFLLGILVLKNIDQKPLFIVICSWMFGLTIILTLIFIQITIFSYNPDFIYFLVLVISVNAIFIQDFNEIFLHEDVRTILYIFLSLLTICIIIFYYDLISLFLVSILGIQEYYFDISIIWIILFLFLLCILFYEIKIRFKIRVIVIIFIVHAFYTLWMLRSMVPSGTDIWAHSITALDIINTGTINFSFKHYDELDSIGYFMALASSISGFDPYVIGIVFPFIFNSISIAIVWIFSQNLFKKQIERMIFVSVATFSGQVINRQVILVGALIGYPFFALSFMMLLFWYKENWKFPSKNLLFFVVFSWGTFLAHHLSFLALLILTIWTLLYYMEKKVKIIGLISLLFLLYVVLVNIGDKVFFILTSYDRTGPIYAYTFDNAPGLLLAIMAIKSRKHRFSSVIILIISILIEILFSNQYGRFFSSLLVILMVIPLLWGSRKSPISEFFLTVFFIIFSMTKMGDLTFSTFDLLGSRWMMYIAISLSYFAVEGFIYIYSFDWQSINPKINTISSNKNLYYSIALISIFLFPILLIVIHHPWEPLCTNQEIDTIKTFEFPEDDLHAIIADQKFNFLVRNFHYGINFNRIIHKNVFSLYNSSSKTELLGLLRGKGKYYTIIIPLLGSKFPNNTGLSGEKMKDFFDLIMNETDHFMIFKNEVCALFSNVNYTMKIVSPIYIG